MTLFTNEGSEVSVNQHCAQECVALEVRGGVCNAKFKRGIEDNSRISFIKPSELRTQPAVTATRITRSL